MDLTRGDVEDASFDKLLGAIRQKHIFELNEKEKDLSDLRDQVTSATNMNRKLHSQLQRAATTCVNCNSVQEALDQMQKAFRTIIQQKDDQIKRYDAFVQSQQTRCKEAGKWLSPIKPLYTSTALPGSPHDLAAVSPECIGSLQRPGPAAGGLMGSDNAGSILDTHAGGAKNSLAQSDTKIGNSRSPSTIESQPAVAHVSDVPSDQPAKEPDLDHCAKLPRAETPASTISISADDCFSPDVADPREGAPSTGASRTSRLFPPAPHSSPEEVQPTVLAEESPIIERSGVRSMSSPSDVAANGDGVANTASPDKKKLRPRDSPLKSSSSSNVLSDSNRRTEGPHVIDLSDSESWPTTPQSDASLHDKKRNDESIRCLDARRSIDLLQGYAADDNSLTEPGPSSRNLTNTAAPAKGSQVAPKSQRSSSYKADSKPKQPQKQSRRRFVEGVASPASRPSKLVQMTLTQSSSGGKADDEAGCLSDAGVLNKTQYVKRSELLRKRRKKPRQPEENQ